MPDKTALIFGELYLSYAELNAAADRVASGLIAQGVCDTLRRPFQDHVFCVNQDNWALPAVETCLLEAAYQAPRVLAGW